ncbi:TIGR03943 family putative permease subunit [uncultured Microbacterium sp.]|uniref:TIGR03943 family putative permease subunit n=1 Tax=uncultured Microbacterium sp. TaxID=191216 RepID=UPI0025E0588C|nr:TIGR03943 family protein [uncultured Microbacterium sp.]
MSERRNAPRESPEGGTRARSVLTGLGARWLGAGLAALLAIATLGLAATGRLTLYISPETVWFAVAAAIVTLVGVVWSCALPLGEERDHGHDHGDAEREHEHHGEGSADAGRVPVSARRVLGTTLAATGGVIATAVAGGALLLPPAALSVDMAMQRSPMNNVLFAGVDDVALGANADTSQFGIGGWASAFATGTRPEKYDGTTVTLTGFLTPDGSAADQAHLTRMVITHCVIDAQPASVPVEIAGWKSQYAVGDWVQIKGTVRVAGDGKLQVVPTGVTKIPEPKDPYEH